MAAHLSDAWRLAVPPRPATATTVLCLRRSLSRSLSLSLRLSLHFIYIGLVVAGKPISYNFFKQLQQLTYHKQQQQQQQVQLQLHYCVVVVACPLLHLAALRTFCQSVSNLESSRI